MLLAFCFFAVLFHVPSIPVPIACHSGHSEVMMTVPLLDPFQANLWYIFIHTIGHWTGAGHCLTYLYFIYTFLY